MFKWKIFIADQLEVEKLCKFWIIPPIRFVLLACRGSHWVLYAIFESINLRNVEAALAISGPRKCPAVWACMAANVEATFVIGWPKLPQGSWRYMYSTTTVYSVVTNCVKRSPWIMQVLSHEKGMIYRYGCKVYYFQYLPKFVKLIENIRSWIIGLKAETYNSSIKICMI